MAYPIDLTIKRVKCNFCGGKRTNKGGFDSKDKKQRYYCRDCQRFFRENAVYRKRKESYAPKLDLLPNETRLIDELRQIAQMLGKTPTTNDIRCLSKEKKCHTLENYYAVFGSYVDAVKAAGLKQHYRQEFDKEKLLSELRKLDKTLNEPMFARHIVEARRQGLVSPKNHFDKAFGSISKAIEAAGVTKKYLFADFSYLPRKQGEYLPRAKPYSRDDLIRHLKKLELKIGRIPRQKDMVENCN